MQLQLPHAGVVTNVGTVQPHPHSPVQEFVAGCLVQGIVALAVTELHVYCGYMLWLGRRINVSTVVL